MLAGKEIEASSMLLSFAVVCASYLLIVWKDRSWINWATPTFFLTAGTRYVFQFFYLYTVEPGGSRYAYILFYATTAASFLIGTLVYAFVRPLFLKGGTRPDDEAGWFPWVLLAAGFFLYLPVLVQFRAYITQPRQIYEMTRTGYGLPFYGSITLISLGFTIYLFSKRKRWWGILVFNCLCIVLVYLHGSKGPLLSYIEIVLLYTVYVRRKRIGALATTGIFAVMSAFLIMLFVFFGSASDFFETVSSVTSYADYVRNAMTVIDDEQGQRYYGEIAVGNVIYSRIPRMLMPSKPKDFGAFILAKKYNPQNYRGDEGTGAFDTVGLLYADFGLFAPLVVCFFSAGAAWITRTLVIHVRRSPSPGCFIVLLYFSGVSLIPVADPSYLFETMVLGWMVTVVARFRIIRHDSPGRVGLQARVGTS